MGKIRTWLDRELSFTEGINSELVATILEKVVVKKESTKEEIHLDIFLKLGTRFEAIYTSAGFSRSIWDKARGSFSWGTEGEFVSAHYGKTAIIRWSAVLVP